MATTAINDLLLAIDQYMSSKGHTGGAGYIANKMEGLFDKLDSKKIATQLNTSFGLLRSTIDDFRIDIELFYEGKNTPFSKLRATTSKTNTILGRFHSKIENIFTNLDKFNLNIGRLTKPRNNISNKGKGSNSKSNEFKLIDIHPALYKPGTAFYKAGLPVNLVDIKGELLNKLGNIFKKESILNPPVGNPIQGKVPNIINNIVNNHPDKNRTNNSKDKSKSGWLSTAIWGLGGIGLLGFLKKGLDNSETGKLIQVKVKDFITNTFTAIGNFLTNSKTIDALKTGGKFLVSSIWFITKSFFTKIIFPVFGKLANEAPTVAKGLLAIGLLKMKSLFNKLTLGLFDVASHIKWLEEFVGKSAGKVTIPKSPNKILGYLRSFMTKYAPKLLKALRWIPGIGLILSLGFAGMRFYNGDIVGGLLEIAAGIAYQFTPAAGVGLALGIGIDAFNAFLDYKQEGEPSKGKARIIGDMWGTARSWIEKKLSISLRNVPVIGGMIRFGEAIDKMSSDPLGGMKSMLESLWFLSPLSMLSSAWTFIDYIESQPIVQVGNSIIKKKITGWFNPTSVIDKVTSWTKSLYDSAMSIFDSSPKPSFTPRGAIMGVQKPKIQATTVNDATIIQPHSRDQILMAKNGGPFDLAMKQMNNILKDKLDELIYAATANVQATVQGSSVVAQAVVASANKGNSSQSAPFNGHDAIRDMRSRVNNSIR